MNEKFVKVEVYVDTTNTEQLGALGAFLATIGGMAIPVPAKDPKDVSTDPAPAHAEPEAPKPARKRSPKPAPQPEAPVEPEAPAAPAEPEKQAEPAKEYTVEEVREKLKEKVSDSAKPLRASSLNWALLMFPVSIRASTLSLSTSLKDLSNGSSYS